MKAVFAASQLGHAPTRYLSMGEIVDYPETPERARRLLQGARAAGLRTALIDPAGLYPDADCPRVGSLGELAARLEQGTLGG